MRPTSFPRRARRRAARLAAYLAALLAPALAAAPAGAQVVYRRLDFDFPAGFSGPYVVNLADGGTFGTFLPGVFPSCPGPGCDWDFGLRFGDLPSWRIILPGTLGVTSPVADAARGVVAAGPAGRALALTLGTLVGEASTFNTDVFGADADALAGAGEQFVGFRFRNEVGGTVHYAWARLRLTLPAAAGTVVDYAFEATPGRAITVGDGIPANVVPEPATLALVGAGLAAGALAAGRAARRPPGRG